MSWESESLKQKKKENKLDIIVKLIIVYLVVANLVAFALMGIDKQKAKKGKYRIPEKTLFLSAIVGGSIGAMYGMHMFRHKTKHLTFKLGMPIILIVQMLLVIVVFV